MTSHLGEDLPVAPRTATPLTANTPVSGMVEKSWSSALYEFTPSNGPALVTFDASSTSSAAQPGLALLPASGKFEDMFAYAGSKALVQMQPSKVYAVYVDSRGGYGYSFNVKANSQQLTTIVENDTANNTFGNAPMLTTMPSLVTNATLASKTDADWYGITITAADVGKSIRVVTTGSDPQTDTVVQVFKANGAAADEYGDPLDADYHEEFTSDPLDAAGKYWVKITASSYFQATHNAYVAAVWLE